MRRSRFRLNFAPARLVANGKNFPGVSGRSLEQPHRLLAVHPAPPAGHVAVDFAAVLLQLEQAEHQTAQRRHDVRAVAVGLVGDARGILAEGGIAAVVRAVLDRVPVSADDLQQPGPVIGVGFGAGDVVGVLLLFLYDPGALEILALAPHRDELSATAQAGVLGGDGFALHSAAFESAVLFAPAGVVLRGKKTPAGVSRSLVSGCRLDCL